MNKHYLISAITVLCISGLNAQKNKHDSIREYYSNKDGHIEFLAFENTGKFYFQVTASEHHWSESYTTDCWFDADGFANYYEDLSQYALSIFLCDRPGTATAVFQKHGNSIELIDEEFPDMSAISCFGNRYVCFFPGQTIYYSKKYYELNEKSGTHYSWDTLKPTHSEIKLKKNMLYHKGILVEGFNSDKDDINYILMSKESTNKRYYAMIAYMDYDFSCLYLFDKTKNEVNCIRISFPRIWNSWSPNSHFSIYTWGYEGESGVTSLNNQTGKTIEFALDQFLIKDSINQYPIEQLILDYTSLEWMNDNKFQANCYVYCNPYVANPEEDGCAEWDLDSWKYGTRSKKKLRLEFDCSDGSIKNLQRL